MSETATLLWEVGFEELPAWACNQIAQQIPELLPEALTNARVGTGADIELTVGPRRFAVTTSVLAQQPSERIEKRGPAVGAAFDADGNPTKACEGFARSAGLTPDQLERREDGGSEFVWAVTEASSDPFATVFPAVAQSVLERLNFGKAMRWGTGEFRFVRPIRWVVTLLDGDVVPYTVYGVESGRESRTHRFLGTARSVEIPSADKYALILGGANVLVNQDERMQRIKRELDVAAKDFGGEWFDPAGVLREVVHLVEWPTVIVGRFDQKYLDLPERVLVTAMQSHQRYIPIRVGDKLAPAFLTAMNGDAAALHSIVPGYERVLVGRLDDAVFSFDRDRQRGLDDMAASLSNVVFHAKAGSLADRRERVRAIAANLAEVVGVGADERKLLDDAARLAKADQVSVLVQEFAELEGFAGNLYARDAGYGDEVCQAIDQQFLPKGPDSPLPGEGIPALVALADKLDLLATMFTIGEQPTGSRDPHGLRRAALGVMRIAFEYDLRFDSVAVFEHAVGQVTGQGFGKADGIVDELVQFLDDRVEKHLRDSGIRVEAVRAARAAKLATIHQLDGLARALNAKVDAGDEHFLSVLTALVRCSKIVEKAQKDGIAIGSDVRPDAFENDNERGLHAALSSLGTPLNSALESENYNEAVATAATLGPAVDAFFDKDTGVMVMADDVDVRSNRLALARMVADVLSPLGDLTHLQL